MDEDVKTLLAILALIYGSSNGVGLFKQALDPAKKNTEELTAVLNDMRSADQYIRDKLKSLIKSLLAPSLLVYVAFVLMPPVFLGLIVWIGPDAALSAIGLAGDGKPTVGPRGRLFYWILLGLSAVCGLELLSDYFKGWRVAFKGWRRPTDTGQS